MSNSRPIPISESGQNNPNVYYNGGFSSSSFDLTYSPQSPPYYLDPRSPRAVFPVPASMQNPAPPTNQWNRKTELLREEMNLHQWIIDQALRDVSNGIAGNSWGYFSYMEYNQCIASTYIKDKEFIIDNSPNPMSYTRLGLASLQGSRSQKAQGIRHSVDKVILSSDEYGNVYITNQSKVPVIMEGFQELEKYCIPEEIILLKGTIMPGNEIVKVFDMEEYRSQIGLQIVNGYDDKEQLHHMSIIRLCFGEAEPELGPPCWILLVNLTAMKMATNEEAITDIQDYIARLRVSNNKSIKESLPSKKKKDQGNQEARRKIRIELRKQGKLIQDNMKYSWNDIYYKKNESALDMETLKQQFEDPDIDYDSNDENDEIPDQDEPQLKVDLQKLKSLVTNKQSTSASHEEKVVRPVKHWAKISYMVKQRTGEGAH